MPMISKSYARNWALAGHNQRAPGNGGIALWLQIEDPWAAVPEHSLTRIPLIGVNSRQFA
jgi:hypothetical protein